MKPIPIALVLLALATSAFAQSKNEVDPVLQMYVDAAKPVAEHARLTGLAGKWKIVTKMWFDPNAAPQIYSGSGTGRMILGGRFVEIRATTKGGGIETDFLTILGFDRRIGEYTMVGYDTLGTYYITAAGKYDDARKLILMNGSYLQPPQNTEQKYRFELARAANGDHVHTLFFNMGGAEIRVAETVYSEVGR